MKKIFLTMMAAALLVVGLMACGGDSSSNPLNIKAPSWSQFVRPKTDGVKLYKAADQNSPKLQIAQEHCEGDMCDFEIIWAGERAPRRWSVNDWDTYVGDIFPILAEEGDFYKVYVSSEWLGVAAEAYIKKSECEVVTPVKLTQEVLDSVGRTGQRRDYVVQKGALKNLCLSSYFGEYDGLEFELGQLCDNCLVFVNTKATWLSPSDEDGPIVFSRNDDKQNESYQISFGKDNYWKSGEESTGLFDTKKLSDEQVADIFNTIRKDSVKIVRVLYYFPEVDKERLQPIALYENVKKGVDNMSEKMISQNGHPFFGDILSFYGRKLREGVDYRQIRQEIGDVINEAKGREILVRGNPYGIRTSKAVISDWNIQSFCLNIILEFVPDDGTNFSNITENYVNNIIYCRAVSGSGAFYKRAAHTNYPPTPHLYVTLIIDSYGKKGYDFRWDKLDYITISEE